MKNLQLYRHTCQHFPEVGDVEYFCVDTILNNVYVHIGSCVYRLPHDSVTVAKELDLKEYYNSTICPRVVGISYNAVLNAVCVAVEDGDVLTLDCDTKEVQCVGFVENGLKAMEWSPDQEIVILVTGLDTIIVMTGTFDAITEVNFHQEHTGEKQFVTVGWGKKETQFHGSEGKAAAHADTKVEIQVLNTDDRRPRVSWRGDGSLFAVSMVEPNTNVRYIRIFSRDGILQYTNEPSPGLEMTLAWRPSGNLIASTQTLPNKYQVIFFEKNGLRHGDFVLPIAPGEGKVCQLAWNVESNVLAVWYQDGNGTYLQLWTVSNYHWYMKQSIAFPDGQQVQAMQWDPEVGLRLHVMCSGLHYSFLEWVWVTNSSCVLASSDRAYVAVINGCNILLSSYLKSVIPPPMCGVKLQLPVAVNQVVFGPASNSNSLCAMLSDGTVAVYDGEDKHTLLRTGAVTWECVQPGPLAVPELHHWLWLSKSKLLCMCTVGRVSYLVLVHMDDAGCLTARSTVDVGDVVLSVVPTPDASGAVIQIQSKCLLLYKPDQNSLKKYQDELPEYYIQMQVYRVEESDIVLGLSNRNRLYVKSHEVANNVTSLFLLPKFLLLTTSHHRLQCLRLVSATLPELHSGRRIERGARLVIAVGTRVILQMPRGNLECITPRPLVLHEAGIKIDAGQYRLVFQLLRTQRINLNLLVDHNPEHFVTDVLKIVDEVNNPSWLALFLLELSEEDVTCTMYAQSYNQPREKILFRPNKVAVVCDLVREAMKVSPNAATFLLPIIASYIQKRTEKDLAAALLEVKAAGKGKISRDEALSYIMYIVDVNELYNVALGLYDFDLAMMVAAKSNKDPKEYVAFLNELRKMELKYQHYSIDKYLKHYSSALDHIALCPDHFDECLDLVKSQNLYLKALQLFPKTSNSYQQVAAVYADKLMCQKSYTEAAIMYQRSQQLPKALEACQKSADWREALLIMSQLDYSGGKAQEACRELASTLVQQRRYQEAAQLLSQHVNDVEESVEVLVLGHYWEEALRMAHHANRLDLVETHVRPGIVDHLEQLQQQLVKSNQQFVAHTARLSVLRSTKHLQLEDNEVEPQEESDLYSDTSSVTGSMLTSSRGSSRSSGRSTRSSKNKRKQERKMLSLKEGSPYEDLALIRALHQLMTSCLNLKDEVRSLCCVLLRFDRDADAANLQHLLSDTLDTMEQAKAEIWLPEISNPQTLMTEGYGPEATSNTIAARMQSGSGLDNGLALLEPHLRIPPSNLNQSSWKLKILSPS